MGIIVKILKKIWYFFEFVGRARSAGILARQGRTQEAVALINQC
jgi:hypothetical protein